MTSAYHGLLVVDKPSGMTSRGVVDRCLGWFPRRTRMGHTGTLDPLATGVLVLCVGAATRLTEYVQQMAKTYQAGLCLGATSDSDDADGTVTPRFMDHPPEHAEVERCLQEFVGDIEQVPPVYSAAKITGQRAYDLARKGQEVTLASRRVRIHRIEVTKYEYPRLDIVVYCGKGTYIRSLARDLGERLGCGALVESLRRTHVGPFEASAAIDLEAKSDSVRAGLLPLSAAVVELPRVTMKPEEVVRFRNGLRITLEPNMLTPGTLEAAVFDVAGSLVAIAEVRSSGQELSPVKVMP